MIDHWKLFWQGDDYSNNWHFLPMIDHRKQFDGEMITLLYANDHSSPRIFCFGGSMSDHRKKVPVRRAIISPPKQLPMSDHLYAKKHQ